MSRWSTLSFLLFSCAPHEAPADVAPAIEPQRPALDEAAAIEVAKTHLLDCSEDSFTANLKTWDGEAWWNVECRHYSSLFTRRHHSIWLRAEDGAARGGADWSVATPAGKTLDRRGGELLSSLLGPRLGLSEDAFCGRNVSRANSFRCFDAGAVYHVLVDAETGEETVSKWDMFALLNRRRPRVD